MSNIFTTSKITYDLNTDTGESSKTLNSMYRVEMLLDYGNPKESNINSVRKNAANNATTRFDGSFNPGNTQTVGDFSYVPISFYVDHNDLPNFNFDANIEEGFKSALLGMMEEKLNQYGGKYLKFMPSYYYAPLADNNTRKIYTSGNFNNISFKFRLYDKHFIKDTKNTFKDDLYFNGKYYTDTITTDPMLAFCHLSSCIFPFGNQGEGGSLNEVFGSILKTFGNILDITKEGMEGLFKKLSGLDPDNKLFTNLIGEMRSRLHGCPIIKLVRLGDRYFNGESIWEFFLTNFTSTFSKDLIYNKLTGKYSPTYIDFELTLTPTFIPSTDKMKKWLLYNEVTEEEKKKGIDESSKILQTNDKLNPVKTGNILAKRLKF